LRGWLVKSQKFLDGTLGAVPRALLLVAALLLVPSYLTPLWNLTMFAPQYPEGLRLHIYSFELAGGNAGQDVREINVLNHYIGMRDLTSADFTEFQWMPFVVGVLGLLFVRGAVMGKRSHLVDVLVLYLYFGLFSMWSFGYKLWKYGHELAPNAAVRVQPFMPPMFGYKKLANFDVYSYPGPGSYGLALAALVLMLALYVTWRGARREFREQA
jgi:hypothetical protein